MGPRIRRLDGPHVGDDARGTAEYSDELPPWSGGWQVVCELPQVTHSYEQPFTVNTVVMGLHPPSVEGQ